MLERSVGVVSDLALLPALATDFSVLGCTVGDEVYPSSPCGAGVDLFSGTRTSLRFSCLR